MIWGVCVVRGGRSVNMGAYIGIRKIAHKSFTIQQGSIVSIGRDVRPSNQRPRYHRTVAPPQLIAGYLVLRNPLGFLTELPSGELVPTTDPSAATHTHVVDPVTEEYTVATIEEAAGLEQPVMIVEGGIIDIYAPNDPSADARSYLEPTALPTEATHVHALDPVTGDLAPFPVAQAAVMDRPENLWWGAPI